MSDSQENMTVDASNPFASPGLPEVQQHDFPNVPSQRVLWIGLVVGFVLNFSSSVPYYFNDDYPVAARLTWIVPDVLYGLMYSLGISLLIHAAIHRRFQTLAPGHWRLIAFLPGLLAPLLGETGPLPYLVQVLNAGGLIVLSSLTRDSRVWKAHAWLCAGTMLLDIFAKGVSDMVQANFTGSPELMSGYLGISAENLPVVGWLANLAIYMLNTLSVLWMLFGVAYDQQRGVRRDRYHYLGLILVALAPTVNFAHYMVFFAG